MKRPLAFLGLVAVLSGCGDAPVPPPSNPPALTTPKTVAGKHSLVTLAGTYHAGMKTDDLNEWKLDGRGAWSRLLRIGGKETKTAGTAAVEGDTLVVLSPSAAPERVRISDDGKELYFNGATFRKD